MPTLTEAPSAERVREAVAAFLNVDPTTIEPRAPLAAYGLDSLRSLELLAWIEDTFGCRLPDSLATECPDFERLSAAVIDLSSPLHVTHNPRAAGDDPPAGPEALMLADSRLPDDIRPRPGERARVETVLLTGATGFLGASLLRTLIDSGVHVVCLARPHGGAAADRVRGNLERYGLWHPDLRDRMTIVSGDLEQPRFGLGYEEYDRLTREVDAIYHAAADVNWVSAYEALRTANVLGTTALLRFACSGVPKPFRFVSSLSVCYACDRTTTVHETSDMLALVGRLPLGYAQSKCVAESLVREAAARGLPAQIYRPALIAGHSVSGASNVDDLIAALLKGCIQMGAAPDLDWIFDAIPVDTAARAIVELGRSSSPELETFHLRHPRPRHWRECVLWANVFGYTLRLEPYDVWLERLLREAVTPDHALYRLRGFFVRRVAGRTIPEHYEAHAQSPVDCSWTRVREQEAAIVYPPLDASRLDAYFRDYIERGFLRPPSTRSRSSSETLHTGNWESPDHLTRLLSEHFHDPQLRVTNAELVRHGSDHSIISELTSWRERRQVGLFHYRLDVTRGGGQETLEVMVKAKPSDDDVLDVAEVTAATCDTVVHRELTRFRDRIGIRGSHVRELEIYGLQALPRRSTDSAKMCAHAAFTRYLPTCYGTWRDDGHQSWGLLLERLQDMAVLDASGDVEAWTDEHIAASVDGLADLHAVWLGREDVLAAKPWIGHIRSGANAADLTPLWCALADHAAPMFAAWAGTSLVRTHARLVETIPAWWPALETLPRTLIHNDFNPRNVGIRRTTTGPRLVVYDWELATIGAPQRDLAEFLCFTLPENTTIGAVRGWIERHRVGLARASGRSIPSTLWMAGFEAALADVLTSRLAFYALIHRVRPQSFLPRVVASWQRIHALVEGHVA